MHVRITATLSSVALMSVALMSACGQKTAAPVTEGAVAEAAKTDVHLTMTTKINPQATLFWDVTAKVQNDDGDVLPDKVDAATWTSLLEGARALEDGAKTLATSSGLLAAAPGVKLQNEESAEAPKVADVQRYLDAMPEEFRQQGAQLQSTAASIVAALEARDGKALGMLSNTLYENCENCHKAFWYPEQPQ